MKKVIIAPNWSEGGNPYQNLLSSGLNDCGYEVIFKNFPANSRLPLNKLARSVPEAKVVHIHWINDYIAPIMWAKNDLVFRLKLLGLIVDCLLLRIRGIRIIWTIHNKVAHESGNINREIQVRRLLARSVSAVIVHSEPAMKYLCELYNYPLYKKATIIPHGNYKSCYPESPSLKALKQKYDLDDQSLVFLFFGAVRPYKGVEMLIDAFQKQTDHNARLLICGKPNSPEYTSELQTKSNKDSRIKLDLRFIDDSEVAGIMSVANYAVVPFVNTLTSGSVILAMTMGKALILPTGAKILGCVPDQGVMYFDDIDSLAELMNNSCTPLLAAQMGAANLEVANNLDWFDIGKATSSVYKGCG